MRAKDGIEVTESLIALYQAHDLPIPLHIWSRAVELGMDLSDTLGPGGFSDDDDNGED